MAAASIRNSQTAEGTSASFAATCPTVVADDVLYAFITADAGGTVSPPAGWLRAPKMGGHTGRAFTGGNVWGYYKIADGTETGTITFTNTDSRTFAMTIMSVQNVNTVYPFGYTRVGTDTADFALPNFFSVFDEGLGMMLFGYNSNVDESGATFTGGDAADWTLPVSIDNATLGLHVGVNSAGFATRIMTTGNGATTLNLAGTLSSAWALVMFNSLDQAPATVSSRLFRAVVSTGAGTSATLQSPSGEFESVGAWGRFFMPGVTIIGAVGGRAAEAVTLSDWDTDNTSKVFTQVAGSPYNNTDASDSQRLWAGYVTLEADDCYVAADDVVHGTFSGAIHHQAAYGGYALADPAAPEITVGAFSSEPTATTAPDPPSFSIAKDGSYAILVSYGTSGASSPTGPTGYTDVVKENISANNQYIYMGEKAVNTGTEDPGALTTPSALHVMLTLSVFSTAVAPPVITTTTLPDGIIGTAYSQTLAATSGTPPYTWSIISGALPAGLSLNSGTGEISGTPTTEEIASFTVQVTDSVLEIDTQALTITVDYAPPVITTATLPNGQLGTYYDQTLVVSGGDLPLAFTVQSGALPGGVALGAGTGRIEGQPTADGTFNFTIRVTDENTNFDDQAYTVIISVPPVEIVTQEHLEDGFVGSPYTQTVQAIGGFGTYAWSVVSGSLPPGLDLSASGTIAGVPTTKGSYYFVLRATSNPTDDQGFYIFVADDPAVSLPEGEEVPTIFWRIVLCNDDGAYISMLDGIASGVELEYKMNRPAMLTFDVPSEDPRVNILGTDSLPYLAIGRRSVKAYRKIGSSAGNWVLRFAGTVWSLEDHGDGDTVRTRATCYDNLKNLEKRIVRNANGGYRTQVRWWNSEVYPAALQSRELVHGVLEHGTGVDGTSGAHIIKEMIRRTKKWGGTLGGDAFANNPQEYAPVGIDTGGGFEETSPMSVSFDQEYILPAITRICDTLTVDLVVNYLDVFNGAWLRLGARARSGTDKTGTVVFAYAASPYSAREYVRTQSLDQIGNYVHLFGKSKHNKDDATASNRQSQLDYRVMEVIETLPEVEHREFLQFLADMRVAMQKDPRDLVTIVPTPEESPVPWNDYWIGDSVTISAASSPFPVTRQTVEGVQRIYGLRITLDDDFGEYVSEMIVSPADA